MKRALVTIKYNSNGDSIWANGYRSLPNRSNWGYSVVIDDSLNVYSSGYGASTPGNEIVTIKYSQNGEQKWIKKLPTNSGDYLRPTLSAIDQESNVIVVGYNYTEATDYDFITLKYSPAGDLLWSRLFSDEFDEYANSIFLDDKNNILIGGSSYHYALRIFRLFDFKILSKR